MIYFGDDKKESLELIFSYILDYLKLIPFRLIFELVIFAIALYVVITLIKCLYISKKNKKLNKMRFERNKNYLHNKESENSKKVYKKIKERDSNFDKELFIKQAIKEFMEMQKRENEKIVVHRVDFLTYSYNDVREIISIALNVSITYYDENENVEKIIKDAKYKVINNTYKMSFIREKDFEQTNCNFGDWMVDKVLLP